MANPSASSFWPGLSKRLLSQELAHRKRYASQHISDKYADDIISIRRQISVAIKQQLTDLERLVARMFFNVGIQSSLALEDPNHRFAVEFNSDPASLSPEATQLADIVSATYKNTMKDGTAILITNPKDKPALVHVVMKGGNPEAVMSALDEAFAQTENVTIMERPPLALSLIHISEPTRPY